VKLVKKSSKGGKPGQWSARKAQLAVKIYKSKGGSYSCRRSSKNSLVRWTKQKWRTRSGKNSIVGTSATGERYLPDHLIKRMSKKDYSYTSRLKRKAIKSRKQFSKQPKKIKKRLSRYLKKN
jgi:hypothetical protein